MAAASITPDFDTRVVIPAFGQSFGPDGELPHGNPESLRLSLTGEAFATSWAVDLYIAPDHLQRLEATLPRRIQSWLDLIDRQMSPYRADSDLTRFNTAAADSFVPLPQVMMQVMRHALDIANLSDGAFDPALLSAVELWGFGARAVPEGLPLNSEISELRDAAHGWRDLVWQRDGMVRPAGVRIDLCAIAKGYAVDGLAQMLRVEPGVSAALVEVGGELKGIGVRPDDLPWWVEVERLSTGDMATGGTATPRTVVALCGQAVATSGDLRRAFEHDGLILSHTIDARTACPARPEIASATVIDEHAWRADALATALIVMGAETATRFAAQNDIACLLRIRDGHGLREVMSPAMEIWA